MSPLNFTHILTQAVDELSESSSYKGLFHQHTDGTPLPSARALQDIVVPSSSPVILVIPQSTAAPSNITSA